MESHRQPIYVDAVTTFSRRAAFDWRCRRTGQDSLHRTGSTRFLSGSFEVEQHTGLLENRSRVVDAATRSKAQQKAMSSLVSEEAGKRWIVLTIADISFGLGSGLSHAKPGLHESLRQNRDWQPTCVMKRQTDPDVEFKCRTSPSPLRTATTGMTGSASYPRIPSGSSGRGISSRCDSSYDRPCSFCLSLRLACRSQFRPKMSQTAHTTSLSNYRAKLPLPPQKSYA